MPSNPNIYSLIRPPQAPPNPLQQYGQAMQIKNLVGRGKIQENVLTEQALNFHRDNLANVNDPETAAQWVMAGFDDPNLSSIMQKAGSPEEVIARIPQDSEEFEKWKMQNALGMQNYFKATKTSGRDDYFRYAQTPEGLVKLDARGRVPPEIVTIGGKPVIGSTSDPALQGQLAGAKATGKVTGETRTEAQFDLPTVINNAEMSLSLVDEMIGSRDGNIKQHPGFTDYVGFTFKPFASKIHGTDAAGFEALLNQIKGGAFLEAFERLKGGGHITEIEGEKATQSTTRMDKAQNEEEFKKAARDYQQVIRKGIERARIKAGQPAQQEPITNQQQAPTGKIKFLGFE
jgi:hypothetical protein